MQVLPLRLRIAATVLIVCAALASGLSTLGQDQPARRDPGPDAPRAAAKPRKYLIPASNCNRCHSHPEDYKRDAEAGRLLCRMNEAVTWTGNDKHKIAYLVLQGDRAKAMGERLGITVSESNACTNCHSTNVPGADQSEKFVREENGVSCVACHGAYIDWVRQHQFPSDPEWRKNTRRQKEELYGMTDLWDPVTRAAKCASCHIGNPDEQKVVTHAMYAAGHPPLPGLEAATFSEAQPRHWQYLREKSEPIQKELGFNRAKREQTDLVVASGIVALREAMRLYAAEARADTLVKEPASPWPDFARFDCYACHHDLKVPSWRQERGYGGRTPGRPPVPPWPEVLVQLGITVADPSGTKGRLSEYQHARDAFHAARSARPFGNREPSAAAAQALADWADAVSRDLRGVIEDPTRVALDGPMALRLLHQLCQMALTAPLDYDSARQIAWSFRIIYEESRAIDPQALNDLELGRQIDALFDQLHLALRSAGKQEKIVDSLPARLSAVFDFDPDAFQAHFAALAQRLPPL
jgi:hypothetical protein